MAFKRWARAKSKNAPVRSWGDDEMKIIGWCLNKKIEISIMPDWKDEVNNWKIDIEKNQFLVEKLKDFSYISYSDYSKWNNLKNLMLTI